MKLTQLLKPGHFHAFLAAALLLPGTASAGVTLTTTNGLGADIGLGNDSQLAPTARDNDGYMNMRRYAGTRMKFPWFRFDKGTNLVGFSGATLTFNVTGSANRARTVNVYGLINGDPGEAWGETTITYNTAPGLLAAATAQVAFDTNRLILLGTIAWPAGPGLITSDPTALNLAPFLDADTDGLVTFMLLPATSDSSQSWDVEGKERADGTAPATLTMPNAIAKPNLPALSWAVGNGAWNSTAANWKDGNGASATYSEIGGLGNDVSLDDSSSGVSPITITLEGSVTPFSMSVSGAKDYTLNGAGTIAGITRITKTGSGTLTLGTANSYVGKLALNGGAVTMSSLANLGAATSPIDFDGGTLRFAPGATEDVSVHPTTFKAGGATFDTTTNTIWCNASIGNGGPGGLTKVGPGALLCTGTNLYSGNTTVSAGTLGLGGGITVPNSPALILNAGAVLDVPSGLTLSGTSGQKLVGTGTVKGTVTVPANTAVSPGTNGVVGTLRLGTASDGGLNLSGGSLVLDVSTAGPRDLIQISGGLAMSSGSLQLLVSGTLANGTYKLVQFDYSLGIALGTIALLGFDQPGQVAFLSDAVAGEINLIVAPLSQNSLVWKGDGIANVWDVSTTLNWLNGGTSAVFNHGDSVTFDNSGSSLPDVSLSALVFPKTITVDATLDYTIADGTFVGGGRISGGTSLTKNGAGKLTLNTVNNNTGPTTINSGTLQVGGHLGSGPVTNHGALIFTPTEARTVASIVGSGHVAQTGVGAVTVAGLATYAGSTTVGTGATLQLGTGGNSGPFASSAVTNDGTLILNNSASFSYSNPIRGMGNLTKSGAGTLTWQGGNESSGTVTVNGGKVILAAAGLLPSGVGKGDVAVGGGATAGGTLDLNGHNTAVNGLNGVAGTVAGRIVNNAPGTTNRLTIGNADAAGDTYAVIADNDGTGGAIAVTKVGSGAQLFHSTSTFTGGMEFEAGTLNLRADNAAGAGLLNIKGTRTILANGVTLSNPIRLAADSELESQGNVTVNSALTGDKTWNLYPAANNTISWGGDMTAFSGTFIMTNNSLFFRFNGSLGSALATFNLGTGTTTLNNRNGGVTIQVGALLGGAGTFLAGASSIANPTTYVIGGNGQSTLFEGAINNGFNNASTSITKAGAGTLTLSGALGYSGATTVTGGTLALSGGAELDDSSAIAIQNGATLDMSGVGGTLTLGTVTNQTLSGSGTLAGALNATANSTVSPGTTIGTLRVTGAAQLDGAVVMELSRFNAGATNDLLDAATITATGTLRVTNVGPTLVTGDTFKLFSKPVSGFASVQLPATDATGAIAYNWENRLAVDGSIRLLAGLNTAPTHLTYSLSAGALEIAWPLDHTGWTLQAQTNSLSVGLSNNWFPVAGSTTTNRVLLPVNPTNGAVFLRMVYP